MAIQSFYTAATKKDFARIFQFRVTEFPGISFGADSHLLYVETATLPGRAINNVPVPYMGLQFNVPGNASYPGSNAYNVTFRMDADYDIRAALEASTFATFDDATSTGAYNIRGSSSDIAGAANNILQLDLLGKGKKAAPAANAPQQAGGTAADTTSSYEVVRRYKLFGAYLVSVNDTAYDIKDTGTVATCQAVIAYHFWRSGAGETTTIAASNASSAVSNYTRTGTETAPSDLKPAEGWTSPS